MSYVFKIVDIIAFDVHTSIQPLLNPGLVRPQFQFVLDPAAYVKQHAGTASFTLGKLTLEPFSTKRNAANHFWQRCASISHGAAPDLWKLQIPFLCTAPTVAVEFSSGLAQARAVVFPSIYLSSLGWCTSLHVRIFGSMTPSDLLGVVDRLRNDPSFLVAGNPNKTLSEAFIAFSSVVKQSLYVAANPLYDRVTTSRHTVISIAKFEGPPAAFAATQMPDAERAEIHSILHGRTINLAQLAKNEAEPSFLQTQYSSFDFALTYFGLGTFLWMQSPRQKGKRTKLWCLPSNLGLCSMFLLALNGFWKSTELQAGASPTIKDLRDAIRFTVNQLAAAYSNKFCRGFLTHHNELAKIV